MKQLNVVLVRIVQFAIFTVFTFMVLAYLGTLLLLPLDGIVMLSGLLTFLGMPGFSASVIAIAVVGYLVYVLYKTPGLGQTLFDIGIDLIMTAYARIVSFEQVVASVKASA